MAIYNFKKRKIMKSILSLLMLMPVSIFADDIFFECEIEEGGSFANIAYNPKTNAASLETDFLDDEIPGRGANYKVIDLRKTADELIIQIDVLGVTTATFRLNRQTLILSGNRKGKCKIVKKDLAF